MPPGSRADGVASLASLRAALVVALARLAGPVALLALPVTGTAAAEAARPMPAPTDRSGEHWCEASLDAAVRTARRGALDAAHAALTELGDQCKGLPQIEHDLGVIALRRGDHDAAVRHLERALAADERTARTVRALREVRRWRAAGAWADALGEAPVRRGPPALELLDSGVPSAAGARRAARDALLRDETVVDYELFEWWNTLRHGDADDVASHYAADASIAEPDAEPDAAGLPDWSEVDTEIAFTERDAVAVVRWTVADADADAMRADARLLLLRAVGDRWLIYRESAL